MVVVMVVTRLMLRQFSLTVFSNGGEDGSDG